MKIVTIIGARPQFVKAAVLSREFRKHSEVNEIIVHTGQHFDENMSEIFFEEMEIPKPTYNLNINGLSHGAMTGQMLEGIEKILIAERPEYVLVYGDTNSTLAGALAARKLEIKVIHVEAGLRSFNMKMPEEINRLMTDRISNILFCPTDISIQNLTKEGFENFDITICKSGDIMEDAARFYASKAPEKSKIIEELNLIEENYILATIHRAENTDNIENLTNIISSLNELHKRCSVVLPIHPRTRKICVDRGINLNFNVIDPVGYFDMIRLINNSKIIITDSGGLQKEAFFFRKYCITIREQTEWIELIDFGYNFIAGTDSNKIISIFNQLQFKEFPEPKNLYGNGTAAIQICKTILNK